jgi:hypothetical protein
MFTLYTINSKSYYLPVKNIPTVTDEMCFDQLKYKIDPHNRLNPLLNLPEKVLWDIISYVGFYQDLLHQTCHKFLQIIQP